MIPTQYPSFETNFSLQYLQVSVAGLIGFRRVHCPMQLVSPDNKKLREVMIG